MNFDYFVEMLARALGGALGQTLGQVAAIFLFFGILYLLWGLPWSRVISKLGFRGKAYWLLFWMMFAPVLLGLLANAINSVALTEILSRICGWSLYIGLLIMALVPRPKEKQAESTSIAQRKDGLNHS
ncbi:hypothetical protein ACN4EK_26280 [Pantanalinema rosaneae CENA516]|uniref:hypothetical protein n=1 Tax=Pantanalinema rosaneae TaxID=1620701 RepID=UPI003D700F32